VRFFLEAIDPSVRASG